MAQLAASAEKFLWSARLLSWEAAATLSEVLITPDGLAGSVTDVMGTLVHEAAHAIALQRGIKDTSRQGLYHNHRKKSRGMSRTAKTDGASPTPLPVHVPPITIVSSAAPPASGSGKAAATTNRIRTPRRRVTTITGAHPACALFTGQRPALS